MTEFKPEDLHLQFEEAFNSGDLEALLALYVPDARLMSEPGQIVTGHVAIREALKPALAIKGHLTVTTVYAVQAGDIAMMQAQSQLNGVAPDGQQVVLSGKTSEVAQRQPDGRALEERVAGLEARLAEQTSHVQSLEQKHQQAREALEHFRQAAKEQRDSELRRHEHQVQQRGLALTTKITTACAVTTRGRHGRTIDLKCTITGL